MLTFAIIYLGLVLIILLIFIFLGIKAFSIGGTFGSIINSIIPAGSLLFFIKFKILYFFFIRISNRVFSILRK